MDYAKLSGPGAAGLTETDKLSIKIGTLIAKIIANGSFPGYAGPSDPAAAIEGVLLGLSLVIEQAPECPNDKALRTTCENMSKRLHYHAQLARAMFKANGVHPIADVLDDWALVPTVN